MTFARIHISVAAIALVTLTASGAFARLAGVNWFTDENRVVLRGKTNTPNDSGKFCSTGSGKLECNIPDYRNRKPDYYLLECERSRLVCEGTMAIPLPSGEPWLVKVEYQILEWTTDHVIAVLSTLHPCATTTLQIDLRGQEVLITETYTKSEAPHPFCVPENIGHTTTYRLENY